MIHRFLSWKKFLWTFQKLGRSNTKKSRVENKNEEKERQEMERREETDLLIDLLEQNECHLKHKRDLAYETMQEQLGILIWDIKYKICEP